MDTKTLQEDPRLAIRPFGGLEPGNDFGPRYRIESVLGRGGMGAVYKAYDKDLDRTVALKLIRQDLTGDPDIMQRFKQELLLASRISQKNVLRIHDLGDVNGLKFISMAYVEGEDLHHLLKREGRLPVARAVEIARQLCGALAAAHAEGVVHRDLKPQNVLIDRAGTAYVSDFGLAKSLEGDVAMTRDGDLLGTPRYMAPEQVEGQPADLRSDLYALGLILYEMVTGDVPFTGGSTFQVMYQRLKEDPKSPKTLNPALPDYLVAIIMRCLERVPDRRYSSAQEIAIDLDAGSAGTSLPSRTGFRPMFGGRTSRSGWFRWAVLAAALVAVSLGPLAVPQFRHLVFRPRLAGTTESGVQGIPSLGKYIAVLPFRVLGEAPTLGYVGEGLQDALSAKLFQLDGVHVASGEAIEKASQRSSLAEIAREAGANLIVEGTIQQAGPRIAIIVKLHDMAEGKVIWSQEFPGTPRDLLTIEDRIYSQLLGALGLKPSDEELARASRRPTENAEAYDDYLKGRDAMRGPHDPESAGKAIGFYNDALQKDANFALAYAGIAGASLVMWHSKRDRTWADKALHAALEAQQLNDELPEVHVALGHVYGATGRTAESIQELERAIQLEPNSDEGYRLLGQAYLASGRKAEAIKAYEKAVQLDQFYWFNQEALGEAYFQDGDFFSALDALRRVTELDPSNPLGYEGIGDVYLGQGKYNDAVAQYQKSLDLRPTYDAYSNLGTAYFYLKRYGDAVKMLEKAVELSPNQEVAVGNLADAYRWSGDAERAGATYDKAIALAIKDLQVNPRDAGALQDLALYYAKKGDPDEAIKYIKNARSINGSDVYGIYTEGVVEAIAGHTEPAIHSLREAFEKGYPTSDAENDPELRKLQTQPEFQRLIKEFSKKPS